MWYSKHRYAAHLATRFPVHFVSVPDRWRWTDLFSLRANVRTTREGVHVVEYRNNLPMRPLWGLLAGLQHRINAWKLRRLMPAGPVLLWSFHPAYALLRHLLKRPGTRCIYHVVDPYQSLPGDVALSRRADLVVAINTWFHDYYRNISRNCILIPHGVGEQDRRTDPAAIAADRDRFGTYVVVAASLNHCTNYALLQRIADRYPHLRVVLIGELFAVPPATLIVRERLLSMPNVVHLGALDPGAMRSIIGGARAGLVTYEFHPTQSKPTTGTRTPLKVLTYLAQQCPVISTINSFIPELDGIAVHKAEDEEHFIRLAGEAVEGMLPFDGPAVEHYLDSVAYDKLIDRILTGLDGSGPGTTNTGTPWN
ncbi:MAG: hypothetical protein KF797_02025 [Flavobacteriales bacterium]|nr:hypothetical protein [Flavobacteriales bacterium]